MRIKRDKTNLIIFVLLSIAYLASIVYFKIDERIQFFIAFIIVNTVRKAFKARSAFKAGDVTMMFEGKMGFNPIDHISLLDLVIIGALILFRSPIIFGQGKNLEIKYRLFKDQRKGMLKVGLASLFSTVLVMIVTGVLFKFNYLFIPYITNQWTLNIYANLIILFRTTYLVAASILLFNLLPLPGFDMFDIVYSYADDDLRIMLYNMNRFSPVFLIILLYIILNTNIFSAIIFDLFRLIQ
ncbi:zinc metalloprotease [Streptobacillus canis]|uniref:hypothetical protein n=1 Tax=Streptobacillus canis TaxID=2678686 RepID=UPI0012E2E8C6|nr:hypothetical protein [Streptobacillus canis]